MTDNERAEIYLMALLFYKDSEQHFITLNAKISEYGLKNESRAAFFIMMTFLAENKLVKQDKGDFGTMKNIDYFQIKQQGINYITNIRKRKILSFLVANKNRHKTVGAISEATEIHENDLDYLLHGMYDEKSIQISWDVFPDYVRKFYADSLSVSKLNGGIYLNEDLFQGNAPLNLKQMESKPIEAPGYKKIKFNVTVVQLLAFFKLLKEAGLIESDLDKDMHEFISNNFQTKRTSKGAISKAKLAKINKTIDNVTANFWIQKFIEMQVIAKKHK